MGKIYLTEKIYLGHAIKLNQNPKNEKDVLKEEVIVMTKVKGQDMYKPINDNGYYDLNKVTPIKDLQKRKTMFITEKQIKSILKGGK